MADGVGDVEADVVLVEAHDVVDIAGDVGGGAEEDVEGGGMDVGEGTGKEVYLEAGGETHFLVHLFHLGIEAVIEFAEDGVFTAEGVDDGAGGEQAGEAAEEFVGGAGLGARTSGPQRR